MRGRHGGNTGESCYYADDEYPSTLSEERYLSGDRLSQRAYGWQYSTEQMKIFTDFHRSYFSAEGQVVRDLRGYVHVVDDRTFLLVPSLGKLDMMIVCKLSEAQSPPDDRSAVSVSGQRTVLCHNRHPSTVALGSYFALDVESFSEMSMPDLLVRPGTTFDDFHGFLFDNWRGLPKYLSESIALSVVSSPCEGTRLGGLVTDLFLDRELHGDINRANRLVADVSHSLDPDLYEPWLIDMPGEKFHLRILKWEQRSISADDPFDPLLETLLDRSVGSNALRERTVNLGRRMVAPPSVNDLAATRADVPLILLSDAQRLRRRNRDPRIADFIVAAHTNDVVVPADVRERWLPRINDKIASLRLEYSDVTAFARLLNPGLNGTTRSVVRTASAFARSFSRRAVNDSAVESSLEVILESFRTALEKWEGITKEPARNHSLMLSLSVEGRRIRNWVKDHRNVTYDEVRENVFPDVREELFRRWFEEAHERGAIYESQPGKYSTV